MSFKAGRWRVAWRVNVPTVLDVCLMARVDGGQRARHRNFRTRGHRSAPRIPPVRRVRATVSREKSLHVLNNDI